MSLSEKEIEKMIDLIDSGQDDNVPMEFKQDYQKIVNGVNFLSEEELRSNLKSIHSSMKTGVFSGKSVFWISGIAAMLVAGFFWWNSARNAPGNFELKMDEVPAYADSASYDSLKKIKINVDKVEE